MEKLLWIGEPYFARSLADCGWSHIYEHIPSNPDESWEHLTELAYFIPDVAVIVANGEYPPIIGMENFPCVTVFYSASFRDWHIPYAQGFDAALVSSFDKIPDFNDAMLAPENIWWSPPFADENAWPDPLVGQTWDCLCLDGEDAEKKEDSFTRQIAAGLSDFHMREGDPARHAPKARILLRHSEKEILDGGVFDALGRGCCLVTPRVKDGLGQIFVDGEQLVAYAPGDAGDALYRIRFLLERPELRKHIATQGHGEVNAFHRAIHRAKALTDHLFDIYMNGPETLTQKRLDNAEFIRDKYLNSLYRETRKKA